MDEKIRKRWMVAECPLKSINQQYESDKVRQKLQGEEKRRRKKIEKEN